MTLLAMAGMGIQRSKEFSASGDQVEIAYSFSCRAAAGHTGNFYLTLLDSSGSPSFPVGVRGAAGQSKADVDLSDKIGPYAVAVTASSGCSWSLQVTGTP